MEWEQVLDKWGIGLGLVIVLGAYLRSIVRWIKSLVTSDLRDLKDGLSTNRAEVQKLRTDIARLDTYLRAKIDHDLQIDKLHHRRDHD